MPVGSCVAPVAPGTSKVVLTGAHAEAGVTDLIGTAARVTVTQLTGGVAIVSGCTVCTVAPAVVGVALALSGPGVAEGGGGADAVTPTGLALWEAIVSVCTSVTVVALVVGFTGTLTSADLAHTVQGAVNVTRALLAPRPAEVSHVTPFASLSGILWFTDTLSIAIGAVPGAECTVTATWAARIPRFFRHVRRPVVAELAHLAVNALGVVLTVLADSAPLVVAMDIQ
jgi:hypothetical protein